MRVHNGSSEEVAVRVFVDGLDVFLFSSDRDPKDPSKPRFSHFVIASGKSEIVPGWHRSLAGSPGFLAFLVTAYGQGASQEGIPAQGPAGVVQVQFSKCHPALPGGGRASP
ncbi:MAG: hypothetical protein U0835_26715 [Isosphaeraceae bacterium]